MNVYARVDQGLVMEVIQPQKWGVDDTNVPPAFLADDWQAIEVRFTADLVAQMVDVTGLDPQPLAGWTYINGVFSPYVAPPPTDAEILASQSAKLQGLTQLSTAQKSALTNRISTINDAIELEMATPEEEAELPIRVLQLKAWKTYAVLLGRVTSQVGWPPEVTWPVQPAEGMDLTVSATAPQTV